MTDETIMDVQEMSAVIFVATLCADSKEKKQAKRIWMRSWVGRRGQYGLYRLQRELEVSSAISQLFVYADESNTEAKI